MGSDEGRDFEEWLGLQLRYAIGPERGPRPRPAQARYASRRGGSRLVAIRSSILAALGTKAAVGGAVTALAVGGGAVAAVHATGSTDPVNWGQHMVQVVEGCKDTEREGAAASASRGIGHCVSAAAQEHGEQQRAQHSEKDEDKTESSNPLSGEREGQESPKPGNGTGGAGTDRGHGNPHPSPTASASPSGHGQGDHGGHGQPTS